MQVAKSSCSIVPLSALFWLLAYANVSAQQDASQRLFSAWDKNKDGVLVPSEVPPDPRKVFAAVDRNGDGKVTLAEHRQGPDRLKLQALFANPNLRNAKPSNANDSVNSDFSIRQTWHQEPNGFDRQVFVRIPEDTKDRKSLPVVIYFHGNGGQASRALVAWRELDPCLFVVPQGYERSWNIYGEKSEAPDVAFVSEIVKQIEKRFPQADMQNVTVIGSSNGGGFIYRLMIEMDPIPFRLAVPTISSLIVQQYHDDTFWMPSQSTKTYDRERELEFGPSSPTILYFHGTRDNVVPFDGGFRGRVKHLSAKETAHAWATARGFRGDPIDDEDVDVIEPGLIAYRYPQQRVTLFKMQDAPHGLAQYRRAAARLILDQR